MHYVHSDQPVIAAATHLAQVVTQQLSQDKQVLLLLSGGSGIAVATELSQQLANTTLKGLFVTLTDERYGKLGHPNENWQQLLDTQFALRGAKLYRPLRDSDKQTTLDKYDDWIKKQFAAADYKLGLFGIGSDGHTAGIKPGSDATSAGGYTTYFKGEDYERMTITYQAIIKLDEGVIQASGEDKARVISQLLHATPSLSDMPAVILRKVPKVTLYTNQPEGN